MSCSILAERFVRLLSFKRPCLQIELSVTLVLPNELARGRVASVKIVQADVHWGFLRKQHAKPGDLVTCVSGGHRQRFAFLRQQYGKKSRRLYRTCVARNGVKLAGGFHPHLAGCVPLLGFVVEF